VTFASALEGVHARRRRSKALRFYRRFVPRGGLCFDVGAHVGERTALFLDLSARVVAVEPQESCAAIMRERFGAQVELVQAALGPEIGEAELLVSDYSTLSSLSPEWVDAVRGSGRFAEFSWNERTVVPMLTLEELIRRFGEPDFCKIDVEGFELEVLHGLARPLRTLSFEFTFERMDRRLATVEHLVRLGMTRFNFSYGESLDLALKEWVAGDEIVSFLLRTPRQIEIFGDVYAAR
jgi:FkbM family methyltransferase